MEILKNKKKCAFTSILACAILLLQVAVSACVIVPSGPLDVEADVGSIHFNGETADFYVLVSSAGTPIDATLTTDLYHNGTLYASLTSSVQPVAEGLYRIPYTIPSEASAGTYALVVSAYYDAFAGTTLKSFLLSQTLTGWNAWLTEIRNNVAIIKTDVGTIQVALENINATIVSIEENVVTIETNIGTVQTSLSSLNPTLTAIQGSTATIQTDMGTIETTINTIQAKVTAIEGNTATISTALGDLTGTITDIQDDIATIKTDIGEIKATLQTNEEETLGATSLWSVLGVAAVIATVTAVALILWKRGKS